VVSALIKQAKKLPKELYKSLTWDRGELTDHRRLRWRPNRRIFLRSAKPVAARVEREHHGLLTQYFPVGHDLSCTRKPSNKVARQATNDHVRPCNLKLQQRDLTHVFFCVDG